MTKFDFLILILVAFISFSGTHFFLWCMSIIDKEKKIKELENIIASYSNIQMDMSFTECIDILDAVIETIFAFRDLPSNKLDPAMFEFSNELKTISAKVVDSISLELKNNLLLYVNEDFIIDYVVKTCRNVLIKQTLDASDVNNRG